MTSLLRTAGVLALLTAALPVDLAVTGAALVRTAVRPPTRRTAAVPRTVLLSGGKMTKALALARAFHADGHRVVLVETAKYRFTGHRTSRAVDAFHVVPEPSDPGYAQALLDVVRREGVDVYVPVCSPVASRYDALAKELLSPWCEVVHLDADVLDRVDDKQQFAELARSLDLPVPDSYRVTAPADVLGLDLPEQAYVLKSIPYDPVRRLDLTPLPRPTRGETQAFLDGLPMSEQQPWVLQAFVEGQEYCTHSTVRDGEVLLHVCCPSSAFQINYASVDKPEIEAWVRRFAKELRLTGQVSLDFIEAPDGTPYAIECNPRTHSAITLMAGQPGVADAYLGTGSGTLRPAPDARPTYWIHHELWRLLTRPSVARLRTILAGRDAIFDPADPLPFLVTHHVQIPWLLVQNALRGGTWTRVDFNIGKLVEPGGD